MKEQNLPYFAGVAAGLIFYAIIIVIAVGLYS